MISLRSNEFRIRVFLGSVGMSSILYLGCIFVFFSDGIIGFCLYLTNSLLYISFYLISIKDDGTRPI